MAKLVEDRPDCINDALNKVRNRLANTGLATSDIYAKWNEILLNWPVSKIVSLLRDDSPDTEQLRACAPFSFGKYESVESVSYAGR